MRFPKTIRHRKGVVKIYAKRKNYPYYRIAYWAEGKRHLATFRTYSEAREKAKTKAKEISEGHAGVALTPAQARDALNAFQILASHQQPGTRSTLTSVVSDHVEILKKLGKHTPREAIERFLATNANVTPKPIKVAVNDFLQAADARTKASEGKRPQLSSKYAYNRRLQLQKFATFFGVTPVSDLTKAQIDLFIGQLGKLKSDSHNEKKAVSAKSRNHYRAMIKQFLAWAVRMDYLSPTHRLMESEGLRPEMANTSEVSFYTPAEFKALLDTATGQLANLRPIIAIGGLAGLRTAELLRLDWADVWRVPGHIEVSAGKSKTRQRRLVEVCASLQKWLQRYHKNKFGLLWEGHEVVFQQKFVVLCDGAIVDGKAVQRRHNGLRHAFCTYHFALHANENLTSQQAGNSPSMIHQHYKALVTKVEAEKWFGITPNDEEQ